MANPSAEVDAFIRSWTEAPDISARSVLVTIFGDTILPVTNSFWLAQLFRLTEAMGFNDRLIRTSMFRLAEDRWLTNERIGRQSRYTLTDHAVRESEQASQRIYHRTTSDWSGTWTLAIIDRGDEPEGRDELIKQLTWSSFIRLGTDLMATPADRTEIVGQLVDRVGYGPPVAVATAEFTELERLVGNGFFAKAYNTEVVEADYGRFVTRYEPMRQVAADCSPVQAFAIRTMLVHDLRRIRLRAPDMPTELLPADWVGDRAQRLAAELYQPLVAGSARALSNILEVDYPPALPDRF